MGKNCLRHWPTMVQAGGNSNSPDCKACAIHSSHLFCWKLLSMLCQEFILLGRASSYPWGKNLNAHVLMLFRCCIHLCLRSKLTLFELSSSSCLPQAQEKWQLWWNALEAYVVFPSGRQNQPTSGTRTVCFCSSLDSRVSNSCAQTRVSTKKRHEDRAALQWKRYVYENWWRTMKSGYH